MKILLLLPWEKDYVAYRDKFSTLLTYAPITLVTLAALVPETLNAGITVCDEMVQKIDFDAHYDIVAISFVTSSAPRAYEIAKKFKAKGSHIVFGGYHTSFMPEEAAQYADTIIIGPSEKSFPQFLLDFKKGNPQKEYNIPCIEPTDYVVPRRDLLPKKGYLNVPCVIASRGCKNKCEFCAINAMDTPNSRPIADVIDEIKSLNTKRLIFFDPNFYQNRDYALELMKEMEKLNIRWGSNATVDVAFDNELIEAARKSGCAGALFGLESINKDALVGASKEFNDPKQYKQAIEIMQANNISVNGCFVLGFDTDTKESLRSFPEQVEYLGVNIVRYAILTPVPNSVLFNKLDTEGRILTRDWTKYTQNKCVFQPKNMSPQELEEIYIKIWKDSYKWRKIWGRVKDVPIQNKMIALGANIGFKYVGSNVDRS